MNKYSYSTDEHQNFYGEFDSPAAAAEREACAEVCENLYYGLRIQPTRSECAEAIRTRGQK